MKHQTIEGPLLPIWSFQIAISKLCLWLFLFFFCFTLQHTGDNKALKTADTLGDRHPICTNATSPTHRCKVLQRSSAPAHAKEDFSLDAAYHLHLRPRCSTTSMQRACISHCPTITPKVSSPFSFVIDFQKKAASFSLLAPMVPVKRGAGDLPFDLESLSVVMDSVLDCTKFRGVFWRRVGDACTINHAAECTLHLFDADPLLSLRAHVLSISLVGCHRRHHMVLIDHTFLSSTSGQISGASCTTAITTTVVTSFNWAHIATSHISSCIAPQRFTEIVVTSLDWAHTTSCMPWSSIVKNGLPN